MPSVTICLDDDAVESIRIPRSRLETELRKELALQLYREGLVAGRGGCQIAQLSKLEFHALLAERKIPQQYDEAELEGDLQTVSQL